MISKCIKILTYFKTFSKVVVYSVLYFGNTSKIFWATIMWRCPLNIPRGETITCDLVTSLLLLKRSPSLVLCRNVVRR